ncbi:RNA polymerase recycling motor ATPase HelR [Microbacterium gorillae]|uniref:RNA polymerase recycling motor ATPase HelR n=1 Tax=Microbacterium gorillae TaxID=1231063 RepID=UPI000590972E|nr:RNA polymerase recycling motor ATPase HelR [Microbacterium gorillae]
MPLASTTVFALPAHLSAKDDPTLIAADERRLAAVGVALAARLADLEHRLAVALATATRAGQEAVERDQAVRRLSSEARVLRRFGLDLCLGRIEPADGGESLYIGRLGLVDERGERLLVDWRAPAAEPFFAATSAHPMGLRSRRRYRWGRGKVVDYWDETFTGERSGMALDDDSAFLATLADARGSRMRDVLGTIATDQDAIIRSDSSGALVVDGGPGTGKTVVALHRTAYLLYADTRVRDRTNGVLFVGPHQPYMAYVDDVLPGLGEDGVLTVTLRDLVTEGAEAGEETDPGVAALKDGADFQRLVEPLVRTLENAPDDDVHVETEWLDVVIRPADWEAAFDAVELGATHNEARDQVRDTLVALLVRRYADEDLPGILVHRELTASPDFRAALDDAWPVVEAAELVSRLYAESGLLERVGPWLSTADIALLRRPAPAAWTTSDLPLLDAVRLRLGDPRVSDVARARAEALAADRDVMDRVVEALQESNEMDDGEGVFSMLRGDDLRSALVDEDATPQLSEDARAGTFTHIVVDEAQELTDAQWQMLIRRCPSRSFTIVGDRAQARRGFRETWAERLARVGITRLTERELTVNYRTPAEIMAVAEPVIRAALPDANVPVSIRSGGVPVRQGAPERLDEILERWLAENPEGVAAVIGAKPRTTSPRVRTLTPMLAKGLEFDLVIVVNPATFGSGVTGAVDRYVAMTRATRELVILGP